MSKKLKLFFVRSFIVLLIVHLAYFLYGYFKFDGVGNINIYTEFYRFKFYDDVSISHFFVSSSFLFFFLVFLVRNHTTQHYSSTVLFKIGSMLLLVSFLNFSFFISYSFGLNAKLKAELSESDFNKDKAIMNVLNPFLYKYTSYSSEKLFNVVNILYPKPYPVVEEIDSTKISDDNYIVESRYFSIDTLKLLTADFDKIGDKANAILDNMGFDKEMLEKRIIARNIVNDSTEIIYKGREVNPRYDEDICIFLENNSLFRAVDGASVEDQQYKAAVKRYKLIYKYDKDSLLYDFKKLDTLFKRYNVESQIVPGQLATDVLYYKDNRNEPLNAIRNNFDRKALTEKFETLDNLFYKPKYLHPSIVGIYFTVIFSVWILLVLIYVLFNYKRKQEEQ